MFESSPLIIGHRGAAGLVAENTLPSFNRAVELGVDAVELDVRLCAGKLCVIHDDTLDRTTNGRGSLSDFSLKELREFDAGDGAQIPLLEEIFAMLPAAIGVNVELKGAGTAQPLAEFLEDQSTQRVLVSSFDHVRLEEFYRLRPDTPVAPLLSRWRPDISQVAGRLTSRFVNLSARIVTESRCRQLRYEGFEVLAYTVNEPTRARELFDMGVTGVFTDYPDRVTRDVLTGRVRV